MDPIIGVRSGDDREGARLPGRGRLPLPTSCAVTAPPVVAAPAAAVPPAAAAFFPSPVRPKPARCKVVVSTTIDRDEIMNVIKDCAASIGFFERSSLTNAAHLEHTDGLQVLVVVTISRAATRVVIMPTTNQFDDGRRMALSAIRPLCDVIESRVRSDFPSQAFAYVEA
ncbi:MAG: hypothetical protein F2735_08000 [Actinobacteria bacterium]|uniref:Unannotated protein n=1 Tax=freshwater metagenome TaxID=449393 RepID=A0A6J6YR50_9ZZZZ|nr:hypothetical protein [Actinomycetota bacterium]MSY19264.1 hypothetical protein [Actinomycetota bacterium]